MWFLKIFTRVKFATQSRSGQRHIAISGLGAFAVNAESADAIGISGRLVSLDLATYRL
jgi:hypothetical protein